jgi:hypothetical protein
MLGTNRNKREQLVNDSGTGRNKREQLVSDSGTGRNKREQLVSDLLESLRNNASWTKRGRIFEIYETIIELRTKGVSIAKIEKCLNAVCFVDDNLAKGSLKTYLSRIRKEKEKPSGTGGGATAVIASSPLPPPVKKSVVNEDAE